MTATRTCELTRLNAVFDFYVELIDCRLADKGSEHPASKNLTLFLPFPLVFGQCGSLLSTDGMILSFNQILLLVYSTFFFNHNSFLDQTCILFRYSGLSDSAQYSGSCLSICF